MICCNIARICVTTSGATEFMFVWIVSCCSMQCREFIEFAVLCSKSETCSKILGPTFDIIRPRRHEDQINFAHEEVTCSQRLFLLFFLLFDFSSERLVLRCENLLACSTSKACLWFRKSSIAARASSILECSPP